MPPTRPWPLPAAAPAASLRGPALATTAMVSALTVIAMPAEAALISISPSATLDIGTVLVGQSATGSITVQDVDPYWWLRNTTVSYAGPSTSATPFRVDNAGTVTLTGWGQSVSRTFTFTPSGRGAQSATATFTATAPTFTTPEVEIRSVTLSATGVAPVATTSGNATLYALPGKAASTTFTITNAGDGNRAGTGSAYNLSMTSNTRSAAAPWTNTTLPSTATGTASLTDNSAGTALPTSSVSSVFTYTGESSRSSSTAVTITSQFSNGNPAGTNAPATLTTTLTGITVAPVASVTSSATAAVTLRVGQSTTIASYTVRNIGDGNLAGADNGGSRLTNLRGSLAASAVPGVGGGGAINLTDGSSQSYTFTYAPTARAAAQTVTLTQNLTNGANAANQGATTTTTTSVTAVGPVYNAKLNGTAVAGGAQVPFVSWGGAALQTSTLLISNITSDSPTGNLTTMNFIVELIASTGEYSFTIGGTTYSPTSGSGITSPTFQLAKGASQSISVQFNNLAQRDAYATLRIRTDEGADFGATASGAVYIYSLRAVPEPGTVFVLGSGLLGLVVARRSRRRRSRVASLTTPAHAAAPTGQTRAAVPW